MHEIKGKIVLVTGGSKGIGSCIVEKFCKLGAEVIFTYANDKSQADSFCDHLKSIKLRASCIKADVRNRDEIYNLMEYVKNHSYLNVLVNNAGINKPTDFDQIKDKDWDEILSVNLKGPFICLQEAINLMKKGRINY